MFVFVGMWCALFTVVHCTVPTSLTTPTASWTVTSSNGSVHLDSSQTHVPGYVHSDLSRAGMVGNPYFGYGDVLQRWIALDSWTYRTTIPIPSTEEEDVASSELWLYFGGLDTSCEIRVLLGEKVLDKWLSSNMFVPSLHVVSLEALSSSTDTEAVVITLELTFDSAIQTASSLHEAYPYEVPASDNPTWQHGAKYRNYIRKEQCSFSWDWGPCFAPAGIWTDVNWYVLPSSSSSSSSLSSLDSDSVIVDWGADVDINSANLRGSVTVTLTALVRGSDTLTISLPAFGLQSKVIMQQAAKSSSCSQQQQQQQQQEADQLYEIVTVQATLADVPVLQSQLWWPAGYGSQTLFDLVVQTESGKQKESKRIGFRKVVLNQKPIGGGEKEKEESGEQLFQFEVNGVPLFAKGANFIPMDAFDDRITVENMTVLLGAAKAANMQMVRVWGGGRYQRDIFYDLCDEMGLLVWQEMTFACALYPTNSAFLRSVSSEISSQVRRLKHHACLAVWGGSNENEVSLWEGTWYQPTVTPTNKVLYAVDYGSLYFDTVWPAVLEEDPVRANGGLFWPSSPSNGIISEDPYQGKWTDPGSTLQGDVHYYNYDVCTDITKFPTAKFVSEYGFQAFPSFWTLSHIAPQSSWSLKSDLMIHRQHHPDGTDQLLKMMGRFFRDVDLTDPVAVFKSQVYLTQVVQVFCIGSESSYYRSIVDSHQTMGSLYWQLNDIWEAPTWASLEYSGKWKLLHYAARNFFSPVLVEAYETNGNLRVFVSNDLFLGDVKKTAHVTVLLSVVRWSDGKKLGTKSFGSEVSYLGVLDLYSGSTAAFLSDNNCSGGPTECFLAMKAVVGNVTMSESVHAFAAMKEIELPKVSISWEVQESTESGCSVLLTSSGGVAAYVYLDVDISGFFSENGFFLYPGIAKKVSFDANYKGFELDTFKKTFEILSVRDTYL